MKRKKLIKRLVVCGVLLFLAAYAFVHYDPETERNTFSETGTITDFSVQSLRGGTIWIDFFSGGQRYYFVDGKGMIPSEYRTSAERKSYYQNKFQGWVDCRETLVFISTREKDLTYVYGHGRTHVVEIRCDGQAVFPISGHNFDQNMHRWELLIIVGLSAILCGAYEWLTSRSTNPARKKKAKRKR